MEQLRQTTIGEFLAQVSAPSPTPGGGGIVALSAATAASLGGMVCALAARKKESAELKELQRTFLDLQQEFLHLAQEDEKAFTAVLVAYRLPPGEKDRAARIDASLRGAAEVPLRIAEKGVHLLSRLRALAPLGTRRSVSDVGVGAILAQGAIEGALLNVRINLAYMKDRSSVDKLRQRSTRLKDEASRIAEQIRAVVHSRIGQ